MAGAEPLPASGAPPTLCPSGRQGYGVRNTFRDPLDELLGLVRYFRQCSYVLKSSDYI